MYSESISKLMNDGGMKTAEQRASQIESILNNFNVKVQEIKPNTVKDTEASKFSEILKSSELEDVKYRLSPTGSASKNEIDSLIKVKAKKYNLDPALLDALVKQESGYKSNAVSHCGAGGLTQLMPGTAKKLGVTNLFDPAQNLEGGAKHLRGLLDKYKGNLILALAAYNAGGGSVDKYKGIPPYKETQNYVKSILANYLNKQS